MPAFSKSLLKIAALSVLAFILAVPSIIPAAARGERPGQFDHYVLSMSWSPTYCAEEGQTRKDAQCSADRPYAFIAHGLWPQYVQGWPEFCATSDRWVEDDTIEEMMDIMPSKGLIIHEWRRHGSCSGLTQDDYFGLVRELFTGIIIPEAYRSPTSDIETTADKLRSDLVAVNPGLAPSMIGIYCGSRRHSGRLSEVRICYSKAGDPIACANTDHRRQCRSSKLFIPAARSR